MADLEQSIPTPNQRLALRVAIICGALPLLAGTGAFGLWRATGSDAFATLGALILYGGVALFMVGCLALIRYLWLAGRQKNLSLARVVWTSLGTAVLLLANFPVAGACILGAIHYTTRYTVEVRNDSAKPMSQVRVSGAGTDEFIGIIEPGATVFLELWFDREGQLELFASKAFEDEVVLLDGYVCGGLGGNAIVTLESDGEFTVRHER